MTPRERQDHLLEVVSSQRFLRKLGLGNEVPFFICPFPASDGKRPVKTVASYGRFRENGREVGMTGGGW